MLYDQFPKYPQAKTANINLRITPGMKVYLIEQGARLGLNLSDYINLVLEQRGEQFTEIEQLNSTVDNLRQQLESTQNQLQEYESVLNPLFEKMEGQTLKLGRESRVIQTRVELLHLLVHCVKIEGPWKSGK
ncbi:MAG: hypothetical protein H6574_24860 [Lewinellaceae bacterium]|nr:hypothetical protein [Saprospiraceae bacterium]MCB9316456.1 hypothetical protein [Lewinellaceae bacterium]MCB9334292.1 hypothetical protein [Lewinellaceae bacterium]